MLAKAKPICLAPHKPAWLKWRFITLTSSQAVFYNHTANLAGSSALIVIYKKGLTSKFMQYIASKSNHPATVFLNQNEITQPYCKIRWFNQTNEIKRCGHGTLAAANFLLHYFSYCPQVFITSCNERFKIKINRQQAQLVLASIESIKSPCYRKLQRVFSLSIKAAYSSANKNGYTLLLFNAQDDLTRLQVDFKALSQLHKNAVIALTVQNTIAHFRYFAPQFGVNEDTATGSAVSVIAPLLFRLYGLNKVTLIQQSPNGALLNYKFNSGQVVIY
ncbi:MAG: PhzF family phenazine biosynthesis protein [Pseudoalteromonas nigrifaciens]|uniref:PhzF family phenazine biosynthesis protein n=1 Tax=Pseudoalteromonas nigrifaciens TaxID=28109 RepID=UPI003F9AC620